MNEEGECDMYDGVKCMRVEEEGEGEEHECRRRG